MSRQPLWGGTLSASANVSDTFTICGSNDWGENFADSIVPCSGFFNNFAIKLNAIEGTGSRTYTVWRGTVASPTSAISWAATSLSITIENGKIQGSNSTIKTFVVAGDFLQIRVTGSGVLNSVHLFIGIVFNPTVNGQTILTGVTATTQLSTATEEFVMAGANDIHTVGLFRMYFPTPGIVRDLFVHIPTSPHTSFSFPSKLRTFDVYKNGILTALGVTISDTSMSATSSSSFSVVDGDYIHLKCTTANSPRSTYLSAGVTFEPTNKDEFINQYCPNAFMPEVNQTHSACNIGGRLSLVFTGANDFYKGYATAPWRMTYSRHHRAKTILAAKGRRYVITESGTHANVINAGSPLDITDSSPTASDRGYNATGFFRQFIIAFNIPTSFKNRITSTSLWHWVDTGSDEVNFF